jgi:hypothetical protein
MGVVALVHSGIAALRIGIAAMPPATRVRRWWHH